MTVTKMKKNESRRVQCCGGQPVPRNFQLFPRFFLPNSQRVHHISMPNDPDHQSHTTSVFAWLNGQPDIPGHYSKCDVSLADAPGRKRKSHPQSQQQPQQFSRKSQRLAAISGNAMSRKSSRKSPTKDLAHTPKVSELQKITLDPVQEQTDHARSAPVLTASRIKPQEPDDRPLMVRLRPSNLQQRSPRSQPPLLRAATPPHPHEPVALAAQRSA